MARTNRKPRKGPPSKTQHGKEKKQLRKNLDDQHLEEPREEWDDRTLYATEVYGVEPEDIGECLRCCSAWPSGMKRCPECGWDGIDLAFLMPMSMPRIYS